MELLEKKEIEMKNVFNGLVIRLDITEQRFSEFEERLREIIGIKIQRERMKFKCHESISNNFKIYTVGISESEERMRPKIYLKKCLNFQ